MKKYEKYLMTNLGYYDDKPHSLVLTDITNNKGNICNHCNRAITGNVYHFDEYKTYLHNDYGSGSKWTDKKWTFCYKCMPYVVGSGFD